MKYRSKEHLVIDAISFKDLIEHGRNHTDGELINGMPWSFEYKGNHISHEDDNKYIVNSLTGQVHIHRDEVLLIDKLGDLHAISDSLFLNQYEQI